MMPSIPPQEEMCDNVRIIVLLGITGGMILSNRCTLAPTILALSIQNKTSFTRPELANYTKT